MSDKITNQIGRVDPQSVQVNRMAEQAAAARSERRSKVNAPAPENQADTPQSSTEGQHNTSSLAMALGNTTLRFQVDSKNNDITILVVDRATDKVIHTIPPEAVKKLPAGELLQYSV
ncbi:MAG TPA: flagellar protein FlaG [Anaerolineaceae bacterium]|nr:flagellar protein FlaG [Anaerolineaceae bacterium]HPN52568.1 flagellar protein FlaG [Anaerolineaceae bacterium]